jgi:hypothetical protein
VATEAHPGEKHSTATVVPWPSAIARTPASEPSRAHDALGVPSAGHDALGTPSATHTIGTEAALFAEAHRIHFEEHDPKRAVEAWDRYLARSRDGRFVPEARYNRALALVRLGRKAEAADALRPFADGAFGDYHRADARTVIDALSR